MQSPRLTRVVYPPNAMSDRAQVVRLQMEQLLSQQGGYYMLVMVMFHDALKPVGNSTLFCHVPACVVEDAVDEAGLLPSKFVDWGAVFYDTNTASIVNSHFIQPKHIRLYEAVTSLLHDVLCFGPPPTAHPQQLHFEATRHFVVVNVEI